MTSEKKMLRPQDGIMLGGVCAAFARYFGVDVTVVRVVLAILTVAGIGSPILIYLICWLVIPQEDAV